MPQYARINSVVALKELRSALASFAETASLALDEVSSEIQRTLAWLTEDRRRHWKKEVRLRQEQQVQAKLALKRKGVFDLALTGGRTSAIDEKKALAKAERRLQEARRRLARTLSWIQRIDKELSDYRAACAGLTGAIDADIPNARARLEKMVESLEAYVALAPPEAPAPVGEGEAESVLRPADAETTVLQTLPDALSLEETAQALRRTTPSADLRTNTPLSAESVNWIGEITLSGPPDELNGGDAVESLGPRGEDKVLLAIPDDQPNLIYLERTAAEEGDSGWYIGVGGATEIPEHRAVRVRDVLEACPVLKHVLDWPAGYLFLIDVTRQIEALFDAHGGLLAQRPHGESAGGRGENGAGGKRGRTV
jgi:hypothetical protein